MDILKAFKILDENYEINVQGSLENPLFQANQIGKLLDIKNVAENLRDFKENEKVLSLTHTHGGIQKTTFLTEIGLYKLLGRSRKPIASTFQSWIIGVIKEIRINGMYKLQSEKDIDKKLIEYQCDIKNHKIFIKANENKNVVYICKLKDFDNKIIIKIGSTQSIKERMSHIANAFNLCEPVLLDVIQCDNHIKFERSLHKNDFIKNYFYPIEMKEGNMSKETYLVNIEQLNDSEAIITLLMKHFFEDLGLPQRFSYMYMKKTVEERKITFMSESIKSHRPPNMPQDAELMVIENMICIFDIITPYKVNFSCNIIF